MLNFTVSVSSSATGARTQEWTVVAQGHSIGHKRIVELSSPLSSLVAVRVDLESPYEGIALKDFAAFGADGCLLPPAPPSAPCSLVLDYMYQGTVVKNASGADTVPECCHACRSLGSACVAFALSAPAPKLSSTCQLFKAVGGGKTVKGAVSGSPSSDRDS